MDNIYLITFGILALPLVLLFAGAFLYSMWYVFYSLVILPWWELLYTLRIVKKAPPYNKQTWTRR